MRKKAQKTDNQKRTKQPARTRDKTFVPGDGEIPPPWDGYLTEQAEKIYWELAEHLRSSKDSRPIDTYLLMQTAFWLDIALNVMKRLRTRRYIETFPNFTRGVSKEMDVMIKAQIQVDKLSGELGIGPAARQKIDAFLDKADDRPDPVLKLIAGGLKRAKG